MLPLTNIIQLETEFVDEVVLPHHKKRNDFNKLKLSLFQLLIETEISNVGR